MANTSSLLQFPTEIRLIIWHFFFANLQIYFHRRRNCAGKAKPRRFTPLSLFLLNQQIHTEVLPIYFSQTLFTFERDVCGHNCDIHSNPRSIPCKMPCFNKLQKVQCKDLDSHFFLQSTGYFKEITVLVDWALWGQLTGHPEPLLELMWDRPRYRSVGIMLARMKDKVETVVLQRDRDPNRAPQFSIWATEETQGLFQSDQVFDQMITFRHGQDAVVRGVPAMKQNVCEETIRKLFTATTGKAIRFEDA